jgi:hypothetical protein
VFDRPGDPGEGRKLRQITRTSKQPVRVRRPMLASAQGQMLAAVTTIRQVRHITRHIQIGLSGRTWHRQQITGQ